MEFFNKKSSKIMRRELRVELLLVELMIILSVILGFCINEVYNNWKLNEVSQIGITEFNQCSDLNLEETAECLREYVSTFYNYTIRSDEIRTIEDIKENGGDCYDYNKLYERLGSELGFDSYSFRITIGDTAHRIAIISDETGYCLLDQFHKINCFKVKNE